MQKMWIELEDMKFYAFHGVFDQERKVGNNFVVSLRVQVNYLQSLEEDCLSQTINYAELYDLVKEEMSQPANLLEYVAGRICKRVFEFSERIASLEVKVAKLNPPFSGDVRQCSVFLRADR